MCDMWKKKQSDILKPIFYQKLPSTLTNITLTGGEPFLRTDIDKIIKNIKKACPKSKITINSNGFLTQQIIQKVKLILKNTPNLSIRISLDGTNKKHNSIRNTPNAYQKATQTITQLKKTKLKNLGICFTLIKDNYQDLNKIFKYSQKQKINFSLIFLDDSNILFGKNKKSFQKINSKLISETQKLIFKRLSTYNPKQWFHACFDQWQLKYQQNHIRPFICDAGINSFYLDSRGNIYICHLKNWKLGNLKKNTFSKIWNSPNKFPVASCTDCWTMCTAKSPIKKHLYKTINKTICLKIKHEIKL
jgi:radical SAM protein with 4Fe4S-binding SPASM domain